MVVERNHRAAACSDRGDDVRVGGATAQVAAHPLADLLVGEFGVGLQIVGDVAGLRRPSTSSSMPTAEQIWPGRAVPALEPVVLEEGLLRPGAALAFAEPRGGGDLRAVVGDGERQAGGGAAAVDQHGAGAALAVVAALLGGR